VTDTQTDDTDRQTTLKKKRGGGYTESLALQEQFRLIVIPKSSPRVQTAIEMLL